MRIYEYSNPNNPISNYQLLDGLLFWPMRGLLANLFITTCKSKPRRYGHDCV